MMSTAACILVDGHEIREVQRDSLRRAYTMVLQDTWLFCGTIFENIVYGRENATMEEVRAAAKSARIDSYIERLPDGYNTMLSDDGVNISKGQRQLITIARAMLSNTSMLILDEATSNVDSRTEIKIQQAMNELMARPHLLRDCTPALHSAGCRSHPCSKRRPRDRKRHA